MNRVFFSVSIVIFALCGVLILGRQLATTRQQQPRHSVAAYLDPTATPSSSIAVKANSQTRSAVGLALTSESKQDSVFDVVIKPFVSEALTRRRERSAADREFGKRVDPALNDHRVNFLLFGYGETHEPPATERGIIGSYTIVSYDYRTGRADLVSLTHDIRGPEIERALSKNGRPSPAVRIDQAYSVGGFPLMRQMLEDATGLSIDFQIAFKDVVIQDLIDQVFGPVQVDVPAEFHVQPFYLDGTKYPKGYFPKGPQMLSGRQVIQFIKTVPEVAGAYDKSLEHNARKHLVFRALLDALNRNSRERVFWLNSAGFLTREIATGSVAFDFDPISLAVNNIGAAAAGFGELVTQANARAAAMPEIKATIYVVDPAHGDGGVQWVKANAVVNSRTRDDIRRGVYPSLDMEIPINANPYGDLATEYWQSVRALVSQSLLEAR